MRFFYRPRAIGLVCILLTLIANPTHAIRKATPDNNASLRNEQSAALGTFIGLSIAGVATPFPFSFGVDVAAYGSELYMRHIPPQFLAPNTVDFYSSQGACKHSVQNTGFTSTMSGMFGFKFQPLDAAPFTGLLNDPNQIDTYHPHSIVKVTATNPYLRGGNEALFPQGHHDIFWQAHTRVNPAFDIAIPAALVAASGYAKFKLISKFKAEKIGKTAFTVAKLAIPLAKKGAQFGLYAGKTSVDSVATFIDQTSYNSALNSTTTSLTVWDTLHPEFLDVDTQAAITSQSITLEATDFGGTKLSRVKEDLYNAFVVADDCETLFAVLQEGAPVLFNIGETTDITWQIDDDGPFKTETTDSRYTLFGDEGVSTQLVQSITVEDTQPPIITVPGGFAYESAETIEFDEIDTLLGTPRIIDLADPRPTFERTNLSQLTPDHRYEIYWTAQDSSNNVSEPQLQLVTIKTPGTNTPPIANYKSPQSTVTGKLLQFTLTGTDIDLIDGQVDPLKFEITNFPDNGQIEFPLYPHFIEDFRLSPVGDNVELANNEVTRTSPLLSLADAFRLEDRANHGTFLKNNICDAPSSDGYDASTDPFKGIIPINFVYEPSFIHVDDAGNYYVRDHFWMCDVQLPSGLKSYRTGISPIPRISKWDKDGNFIAMQELYPLPGKTYEPNTLGTGFWPADNFSFDELGRIWITSSRNYSEINVFLFDDYRFSDVRLMSLSSQFTTLYAHGEVPVDFDSRREGEEFSGIAVDREREIYYDLRGWGFKPTKLENTDVLLEDLPDLNVVFDANNPRPELFQGYRTIPGCFPGRGNGTCYFSGTRANNYQKLAATDIEVDNEGNVYILHTSLSRIYKYAPPTENADGTWKPGNLIGWMGRCDGNLANANNVDYNACDVDNGVSRGFTCSAQKCMVAEAAGDRPGQFNKPEEITLDDNDILYVADTGNKRVQRFGQDGTFAGEANSTGGGFVLGNFKAPRNLSVNAKGFFILETDVDNSDYFLHAYQALPFSDMTPSSATLSYRSNFGFRGSDQLAFLVHDGLVSSDPTTVDITVTRDYNPPEQLTSECFSDADLTTPRSCTMNEDGALYIRVSSRDKDGFLNAENNGALGAAEGLDVHQFVVASEPTNGTLTRLEALTSDNTAVYQYKPFDDYNGSDAFSFFALDIQDNSQLSLRSAETPVVDITIAPVPDPVFINAPTNIKVPRGFRAVLAITYTDVDQQDHSALDSWDWNTDDAQVISNFTEYLVPGTGNFDGNGREISPETEFANGNGMLVGSHIFTEPTTGNIRLTLNNTDIDLYAIEYLSVANIQVDVIETTQLALETPVMGIDPGTPFTVDFSVVNRAPEGWAGLPSPNAMLTFELPEFVTLEQNDARCGLTDGVVSCALTEADGAIAIGDQVDLQFEMSVATEAAGEALGLNLDITLTDDVANVYGDDFSVVVFEFNNIDGDATLDFEDQFPNDPRYSADTDQDGLADRWEDTHGYDKFTANDTTTDEDGDGFTLLEEFTNNSYPRLAEQPARVAGVTFEPFADEELPNLEDKFGITLASGDVDQDGYSDVVVGAPAEEMGSAVYLYYGGPEGSSQRTAKLTPDRDQFQYGRSLAVGDFDNNGLPDIAVGSNEDVSIYLNNGRFINYADRLITRPEYPSNFATFLTSGDLDNDNQDDLIVLASVNGYGVALAYLSTLGGLDAEPLQTPFSLFGIGDSAVIADIDGDALSDLILGAGFYDAGKVYGFLGADNAWASGDEMTQSFTLESPSVQRFGFSIASGDVTADGIDDLVVGAYSGAGAVYVYDSATAYWIPESAPDLLSIVPPAYTFTGISAEEGDNSADQLGVRVAVGNTDLDAYADIVVGANRAGNEDRGQVRIFKGGPAGPVEDPDTINGEIAGGLLGHYVVVANDMDGDGIGDIIAGAPDIDTFGSTPEKGGYVKTFHYGYTKQDAITDADNDGVDDSADNCISASNTDQMDTDGDGDGNACDADIDNDTVANDDDNCLTIVNVDQINTDGDFEGDACDGDDDNDAIADADDAFPLDERYTTDSDNDGLADAYETEYGLNPNDLSDAILDTDNDGLTNLEEFEQGMNPNLDEIAPVLTAPSSIKISATGPFTPVNLGAAVVTDNKDGDITATANPVGPFVPGRHVITWTAADAAGNLTEATQQLDVLPLAEFVGTMHYAEEGSNIVVEVKLNGHFAEPPVTIPITLSGTATQNVDYRISSDTIDITEQTGQVTINILDDATEELGETLILTLGEPTNASLGSATQATVHIVGDNIAPHVKLSITQNDTLRSSVLTTEGHVLIEAHIEDPNQNDTFTVDWSGSDPELNPSDNASGNYLIVNPQDLETGTYPVSVSVTDSGSPAQSTLATRWIKVLSTEPDLSIIADSDGDGMSDADEGLADQNQNGVDDYLEPTPAAHILPGKGDARTVLQTESGLTLKQGLTAAFSGTDAEITLDDLMLYGNQGAMAMNIEDDQFDYGFGIFDFEVTGLAREGLSAPIVVPLLAAIPTHAVYRKYWTDVGWRRFIEDDKNRLASAPGVLGTCPAPGHSLYQPGLNAGDYCVQLTIEDGGPNDLDGTADRVIKDPSGAAVVSETATVEFTPIPVVNQTVQAGTTHVVVQRFQLRSNTIAVQLNAITVEASGTGDDSTDIAAVKLWLDANNDGVIDDGDTELGSGSFPENDGTLRFAPHLPIALNSTSTAFLVTYDFQ